MNGREILEALSFIDDELLAASEAPARKAPWKRWAALAACLCVLMLSAFSWLTLGRGGATEGAMEEYAAESAKAMGTADQAAPESAAEPAAVSETNAAASTENGVCDEALEAPPTARVEILELTEEGFTARILEASFSFTGAQTVTVVLTEELPAELAVGGEYTIHIESIDRETGVLLVCAVE